MPESLKLLSLKCNSDFYVNLFLNVADKDYTISSEQPITENSEQSSYAEAIHTSITRTTGVKKPKKRWTTSERITALQTFKAYMDKETNSITNSEITNMLANNPNMFKGRNHETIRTWIHGQRKKGTKPISVNIDVLCKIK